MGIVYSKLGLSLTELGLSHSKLGLSDSNLGLSLNELGLLLSKPGLLHDTFGLLLREFGLSHSEAKLLHSYCGVIQSSSAPGALEYLKGRTACSTMTCVPEAVLPGAVNTSQRQDWVPASWGLCCGGGSVQQNGNNSFADGVNLDGRRWQGHRMQKSDHVGCTTQRMPGLSRLETVRLERCAIPWWMLTPYTQHVPLLGAQTLLFPSSLPAAVRTLNSVPSNFNTLKSSGKIGKQILHSRSPSALCETLNQSTITTFNSDAKTGKPALHSRGVCCGTRTAAVESQQHNSVLEVQQDVTEDTHHAHEQAYSVSEQCRDWVSSVTNRAAGHEGDVSRQQTTGEQAVCDVPLVKALASDRSGVRLGQEGTVNTLDADGSGGKPGHDSAVESLDADGSDVKPQREDTLEALVTETSTKEASPTLDTAQSVRGSRGVVLSGHMSLTQKFVTCSSIDRWVQLVTDHHQHMTPDEVVAAIDALLHFTLPHSAPSYPSRELSQPLTVDNRQPLSQQGKKLLNKGGRLGGAGDKASWQAKRKRESDADGFLNEAQVTGDNLRHMGMTTQGQVVTADNVGHMGMTRQGQVVIADKVVGVGVTTQGQVVTTDKVAGASMITGHIVTKGQVGLGVSDQLIHAFDSVGDRTSTGVHTEEACVDDPNTMREVRGWENEKQRDSVYCENVVPASASVQQTGPSTSAVPADDRCKLPGAQVPTAHLPPLSTHACSSSNTALDGRAEHRPLRPIDDAFMGLMKAVVPDPPPGVGGWEPKLAAVIHDIQVNAAPGITAAGPAGVEAATVVEPAVVVGAGTVVQPAAVVEAAAVVESATVLEAAVVAEAATVMEAAAVAEAAVVEAAGVQGSSSARTAQLPSPTLWPAQQPLQWMHFLSSRLLTHIPVPATTAAVHAATPVHNASNNCVVWEGGHASMGMRETHGRRQQNVGAGTASGQHDDDSMLPSTHAHHVPTKDSSSSSSSSSSCSALSSSSPSLPSSSSVASSPREGNATSSARTRTFQDDKTSIAHAHDPQTNNSTNSTTFPSVHPAATPKLSLSPVGLHHVLCLLSAWWQLHYKPSEGRLCMLGAFCHDMLHQLPEDQWDVHSFSSLCVLFWRLGLPAEMLFWGLAANWFQRHHRRVQGTLGLVKVLKVCEALVAVDRKVDQLLRSFFRDVEADVRKLSAPHLARTALLYAACQWNAPVLFGKLMDALAHKQNDLSKRERLQLLCSFNQTSMPFHPKRLIGRLVHGLRVNKLTRSEILKLLEALTGLGYMDSQVFEEAAVTIYKDVSHGLCSPRDLALLARTFAQVPDPPSSLMWAVAHSAAEQFPHFHMQDMRDVVVAAAQCGTDHPMLFSRMRAFVQENVDGISAGVLADVVWATVRLARHTRQMMETVAPVITEHLGSLTAEQLVHLAFACAVGDYTGTLDLGLVADQLLQCQCIQPEASASAGGPQRVYLSSSAAEMVGTLSESSSVKKSRQLGGNISGGNFQLGRHSLGGNSPGGNNLRGTNLGGNNSGGNTSGGNLPGGVPLVHMLGYQELSMLAISYAIAGIHHPRLMQAVAERGVRLSKSMPCENVAMLLTCFGQIGCRHGRLFDVAGNELCRRLRNTLPDMEPCEEGEASEQMPEGWEETELNFTGVHMVL